MNPEDLNDSEQDKERIERERLKPKGERVVIDAPNLEDHATVDGIGVLDTDLKHAFLRKYGHLFCMDRGQKNEGSELCAYNPTTGMWSRAKIRELIHAQVATMSKDIIRNEFNDLMTNMQTVAPEDRDQFDRQRNHLMKLIQRWGKANTISSIATMVYNHLTALHISKPVEMNPDPLLLSCADGIVVDLKTGEHRYAKPEDYLTVTTGTRFDPDADYSEWEKVARQIFGSEQMYEFMHRWAGYCVTGLRWDHALVVLFGSGNNGKSLFTDAIANALGDYACKMDTDFSKESKADGGNNELYAKATLNGVRFALMSETERDTGLKSSMIKSLTGDDTITARHAHQGFKTFKATHKFTLATNFTPNIPRKDNAMFNRLMPVEMKVKYGSPEQVETGYAHFVQDPTIMDRCSKPKGKSALILWLVKGTQKYLAEGRLNPPEEVLRQLAIHRKNMDHVGTFIHEATQYIGKVELEKLQSSSTSGGNAEKRAVWEAITDKCQIECTTFFRMYQAWCRNTGVDKRKMESKSEFNEYVMTNGRMWTDEDNQTLVMPSMHEHRTSKARLYRWVKLTDEGRVLLNRTMNEYNSDKY